MKKITVNTISTYTNKGMRAEQNLAYTLTGEIRKGDHVPFHIDSDIPEFQMSVKADGFSLASGSINMGETFEEKLADYIARVHSTSFAYVTNEDEAFIMTLDEFEQFIREFCTLARESSSHGGQTKIRCRHESKKMREWLNERA